MALPTGTIYQFHQTLLDRPALIYLKPIISGSLFRNDKSDRVIITPYLITPQDHRKQLPTEFLAAIPTTQRTWYNVLSTPRMTFEVGVQLLQLVCAASFCWS